MTTMVLKNWVIALIEQADDEKCLRQRELFWEHKLYAFYPNGLNQRDLCSLLITRIPFNRFSHCEDVFIFMYVQILLLFTLTNC